MRIPVKCNIANIRGGTIQRLDVEGLFVHRDTLRTSILLPKKKCVGVWCVRQSLRMAQAEFLRVNGSDLMPGFAGLLRQGDITCSGNNQGNDHKKNQKIPYGDSPPGTNPSAFLMK